jgi:erythromycin esterase-like protein
MKPYYTLLVLLFVVHSSALRAQDPVAAIDITNSPNFKGLELLDLTNKKVFVIAEDVHNRALVPDATLKFLMYLHAYKGIRTLAIEGGASTAYLINQYLAYQDTTLLREIIRHTFYWSKEHHTFLQNLATWNQTLPVDKRITVESADIELKQESVILAVNCMLKDKEVSRSKYLEGFRRIYNEKETHREQFQALNTLYYYDKDQCRSLVQSVAKEMEKNPHLYNDIFGENSKLFSRMIDDLLELYVFNYKADIKFRYRDEIIYKKLLWLQSTSPEGFLYVVGAKHTYPDASANRLNHETNSPFRSQVIFILTTGKKKNGKYEGAKAVTKTSRAYPHVFNSSNPVLIKNGNSPDHHFNYVLAFATNDHVTPFPNSYRR